MSKRTIEHKIVLDKWTRLGLFALAIGVLANAWPKDVGIVEQAMAFASERFQVRLIGEKSGLDGMSVPGPIQLQIKHSGQIRN